MRTDATQLDPIVERDVAEIVARVGPRFSALSGASIVVTGASGMLGGYVADVVSSLDRLGALASPCVVHLITRHAPRRDGRLGHLLARHDVHFVTGDPLVPGALPSRADVIVHAASPASPRAYMADPVGTLDANSRYLRALLDLGRQSDLRALLYISTSEVYGDPPPDAIPTAETFVGRVDPQSPRSSYVEGKRFGESLTLAFHRQYGLPANIVRPFHVHGPGLRLDDGRIVADLIRVGLDGDRFDLASDGSATRCYGYVVDAVVGMFLALLADRHGETYNIGTDAPETSILELASLVATLMGTPAPRPSMSPVPDHLAGAPRRSRPDLTKARTQLGYEAHVPLAEGLRRTIEWHRSRRATGPTA